VKMPKLLCHHILVKMQGLLEFGCLVSGEKNVSLIFYHSTQLLQGRPILSTIKSSTEVMS